MGLINIGLGRECHHNVAVNLLINSIRQLILDIHHLSYDDIMMTHTQIRFRKFSAIVCNYLVIIALSQSPMSCYVHRSSRCDLIDQSTIFF